MSRLRSRMEDLMATAVEPGARSAVKDTEIEREADAG